MALNETANACKYVDMWPNWSASGSKHGLGLVIGDVVKVVFSTFCD